MQAGLQEKQAGRPAIRALAYWQARLDRHTTWRDARAGDGLTDCDLRGSARDDVAWDAVP